MTDKVGREEKKKPVGKSRRMRRVRGKKKKEKET